MTHLYHFLVSNQLLNSSFFIASATLIVGFAAYFLYKKQKRDEKKDAATILLAEIRNATAILPGVKSRFKKNGALEEGTVLLPGESWGKYKYLFVNDLKSEEWRAVDAFYKNCLTYDEALIEKQSFFAQNTGQIWVSIHKNYHDTLQQHFIDNPSLEISQESRGNIVEIPQALSERISAFTDTYIANSTQLAGYDPIKPNTDAERALQEINDNILLSSVSGSLERIANPKYFWQK